VTSLESATPYRVSTADEALQVSLTGGSSDVVSGTITSMVSIGDIQCVGISTAATAGVPSKILAVGAKLSRKKSLDEHNCFSSDALE
jgi:NAD(P)H-hydrate repair Nnr-like enzyme with NAD(P)H-hydrate dehydratase domain